MVPVCLQYCCIGSLVPSPQTPTDVKLAIMACAASMGIILVMTSAAMHRTNESSTLIMGT